jgi:hypothetical protein
LRAPLVTVAVVVAALAGCRERGRPDPDIRMAVSHEPRGNPTEEAPPPRGVPTRLVVPEEVQNAYSGIRLAWKDSASGKEGILDVPLEGTARIPGTSLDVRADVFLPAFSMTEEVITSSGIEPENPAARLEVFEGGKGVFAGWIFTRFPDVHPFTHPSVSIRLEGGVRKSSS